ncbi:GntR family transcriptional regulator [Irregularibacter muris]|uniref:GntR family transcriptional regulator n=1 Tax=Irregularibacter muris TaxID=1796619 RepID=A0AAE3HED0_9FIRM|nr:GntR family transcriptional regulator [Irregularibacter muris]MCR1897679.1 GntR family transcriptional regulator [Irregularibacter muris]
MYLKSNAMPISVDEVYKDMLERIINLELEPGRKISENETCAEYNVSRSVIRTVFTRLKAQKLVEIYPQRGTYISLIDVNYVNDVLFLRNALEKECLSKIIKLPHKEELIKELEKNLEQQKLYYHREGYPDEYKMLDEEFHNLLISGSKRKGLIDLIKEPLIHVNRWRNLYVSYTHSLSDIFDEHQAIVKALKDNDLKLAQTHIEEHIRTIAEASTESSQAFPQYFHFLSE